MNLYVHFPFCRRKCTYCALHSHAGSTVAERAGYVRQLCAAIPRRHYRTVYFGGGSPALCPFEPLLEHLSGDEFTVEIHPLDVDRERLLRWRDGGVNRISMGVQALDDATLKSMGRGYTIDTARRAFATVREIFDNAGIDLIAGYPARAGETPRKTAPAIAQLADWGLSHCSVYSLIREREAALAKITARNPSAWCYPGDDETADEILQIAQGLAAIGLQRYEISNYALPGRECRHNLSVWRGEDYLGMGDGAHGRIGRLRTVNWWGETPPPPGCRPARSETVSDDFDRRERALFALRTREGIVADAFPEWRKILERFAREGSVRPAPGGRFTLTERGTEICDSLLAELV